MESTLDLAWLGLWHYETKDQEKLKNLNPEQKQWHKSKENWMFWFVICYFQKKYVVLFCSINVFPVNEMVSSVGTSWDKDDLND